MKAILEKMLAENFPEFMKDFICQIKNIITMSTIFVI